MSYNTPVPKSFTTALIIDDEPDICYLLSALLKQKKMNVEVANSLSAATIVLQNHIPDLVFLDNHLPDGMGMDFIEHIKSHHPSSKIIMITAHDTFTDRQRAVSEGVDHFISKPFSRDTVFQAVDHVSTKQYNTQL